ncbi:hypothetical protein BKA70DRAFT_1284808 [Coprinopsis sp. MPI-PUGE-AT-0042]|nr:hypothetical protein BKA70DRAFT_1284808 [Coprinopsis sp. MPI-PUGE-AT-0042]
MDPLLLPGTRTNKDCNPLRPIGVLSVLECVLYDDGSIRDAEFQVRSLLPSQGMSELFRAFNHTSSLLPAVLGNLLFEGRDLGVEAAVDGNLRVSVSEGPCSGVRSSGSGSTGVLVNGDYVLTPSHHILRILQPSLVQACSLSYPSASPRPPTGESPPSNNTHTPRRLPARFDTTSPSILLSSSVAGRER